MLRDEVLEAMAAHAEAWGNPTTAASIRAGDWDRGGCNRTAQLGTAKAAMAVIDRYEAVEVEVDSQFRLVSPRGTMGHLSYHDTPTIYMKKPEQEPVTLPRETLALIIEHAKDVPELTPETKQAIEDGEKLLT
ncbi:MAG: hypothetical protein KOO60_10825 [Gemmatimonadales bacterium]|nr:hypothetical protein [Gemmatimonadales bacterium]